MRGGRSPRIRASWLNARPTTPPGSSGQRPRRRRADHRTGGAWTGAPAAEEPTEHPMSDDLAPSELTTALEQEDGRPVLRVEGEVDLLTTPVLVEALDGALAGAVRVTVDLCEVVFMDSTGLRALLEARRRAEEAGGGIDLRVRDGGPVARLLD